VQRSRGRPGRASADAGARRWRAPAPHPAPVHPIGHDLLRRLDRELAGHDAVGRVWLVELALDGEDVLLVGVEVPGKDPAEAERIADGLRPRLVPLLPSALYDGVDFRAMTDPQLAADVAATDAPVYRRRPR
jgi:hypothetical protein